MSPSSHRRY
jgi:hypothetical protein